MNKIKLYQNKIITMDIDVIVPAKELNNIDNYIYNIINKKKNKCNRYGYLYNLNKIISKSDGIIYDMKCDVLYNIIYNGLICNPEIKDYIKCTVVQKKNEITMNDVIAKNGPMIIVVFKNELYNEEQINTKDLKEGDNIIVQIIAKKIELGQNLIKIASNFIKFCND